jgi:DHA1 family tetracycline resistance protein-like MFS transporter
VTPQQRLFGVYTVIGAVLIDSIGFGVILPVLPTLIASIANVPMSEAAALGGWLMVAFALTQFLFGPIMGNLSDRFGRRPIILLSLFAFAFNYALMAYAPSFGWLFVGRLVSGMAGAIYGPANAYIADALPQEERAKYFGYIGAAFGIGFILGPALGGVLGDFGPRAPFLAAAILAAANGVIGLFLLPESLGADLRRPFVLANANPWSAARRIWAFESIRGLILAQFLWMLAHFAYPSAWAFYMKLKFDWSPTMIGLSLAYVGLMMTVAQISLVGPVIKRLGERRALELGMVIAIVELLGTGLSPVGWAIFVTMTIGALEGLVYPCMSAQLTAAVPKDRQGELQGGLASLQSIAEIIAPALFTQTLSFFSADATPLYFPGAPFVIAAGFVLGALMIIRRNRPA